LFARLFSKSDRDIYKYAYISLGAAAKQLAESELNRTFSFFAQISLEQATRDNFEKEASKVARSLSGQSREAWDRIIADKLDFIKTDLYVFHLLKLYSWGFHIIEPEGRLSKDSHAIRPKPGQPRGANRR
jgi:hypothetical protein